MAEPAAAASLATMVVIGLVGSGHCIGMCGGIATGLGLASRERRGIALVVGYNLGRITSYAMAGALVATLGYWGSRYLALGPALRIAAGLILILMGLYVSGWWPVLVRLEKLGARLWKYIQPLGSHVMPVTGIGRALVLGMVWGWLPCGLVYTALAYAAASGGTLEGALTMAAFGLGTAPAMVAGGLLSRSVVKVFQSRYVRIVMAALMIVFGLWTLATTVSHTGHGSGDSAGMNQHSHH